MPKQEKCVQTGQGIHSWYKSQNRLSYEGTHINSKADTNDDLAPLQSNQCLPTEIWPDEHPGHTLLKPH